MTEPEHIPFDGRPAILIVSSDDSLVELIVLILSPNYQLDHVSDIPEALDKLQRCQYALVLYADLRDRSRGAELFGLVRVGKAGERCCSLPFLLVAPSRIDWIGCVIYPPGMFFLQPPFDRRELVAEVEYILRHQSEQNLSLRR